MTKDVVNHLNKKLKELGDNCDKMEQAIEFIAQKTGTDFYDEVLMERLSGYISGYRAAIRDIEKMGK